MNIKGRAEIIAHKYVTGNHKVLTDEEKVKYLAGEIKQYSKDSVEEILTAIQHEQRLIKDAISIIDFAQAKINKLIFEYENNRG